ncbi:MAG: hypothetical protein KDD53_11155, partial [Bdellovibrionales bacterium]|nr:hypothetical protein [Bdellovibrionales bacterium]
MTPREGLSEPSTPSPFGTNKKSFVELLSRKIPNVSGIRCVIDTNGIGHTEAYKGVDSLLAQGEIPSLLNDARKKIKSKRKKSLKKLKTQISFQSTDAIKAKIKKIKKRARNKLRAIGYAEERVAQCHAQDFIQMYVSILEEQFSYKSGKTLNSTTNCTPEIEGFILKGSQSLSSILQIPEDLFQNESSSSFVKLKAQNIYSLNFPEKLFPMSVLFARNADGVLVPLLHTVSSDNTVEIPVNTNVQSGTINGEIIGVSAVNTGAETTVCVSDPFPYTVKSGSDEGGSGVGSGEEQDLFIANVFPNGFTTATDTMVTVTGEISFGTKLLGKIEDQEFEIPTNFELASGA